MARVPRQRSPTGGRFLAITGVIKKTAPKGGFYVHRRWPLRYRHTRVSRLLKLGPLLYTS
jgi:hypothetical protein